MITLVPPSNSSSQVHTIFSKLHSFIDTLDTKLLSKIQSIQHTFAQQYRISVRAMNDQLQQIRTRLDAAALKQKSNGKIKMLEEERNLFREMSRELDKKLREQVEMGKRVKEEKRGLEEEVEVLRKVCFKLEMEGSKNRKEMGEGKGNGLSGESTKRETINKDTLREVLRSLQKQKQQKQKSHKPSDINRFQTLEPSTHPKSSSKLSSTRQHASHSLLPLKRNLSYTSPNPKPFSSSPSPSPLPNPHLLQFQQIFTSCLNSIKKQLLYRTATTLSNNYHHFVEQGKEIPFERLTQTDRKELVKMWMEDQRVMERLYEFVFQKVWGKGENGNGEEERMRGTTVRLFDTRYNQKNLEMMKRKFEERVEMKRLGTGRSTGRGRE